MPKVRTSFGLQRGEYGDLIGDSLVSASTIAYAGAFTPDFRKLLVTEWRQMLAAYTIPHSPGVDVRATLADQVQMRNWKLCELPQDSHSVENAIVMAQARRYSLFIDPQGQANKFIKNISQQYVPTTFWGLDISQQHLSILIFSNNTFRS